MRSVYLGKTGVLLISHSFVTSFSTQEKGILFLLNSSKFRWLFLFLKPDSHCIDIYLVNIFFYYYKTLVNSHLANNLLMCTVNVLEILNIHNHFVIGLRTIKQPCEDLNGFKGTVCNFRH